MKPEGYAAISLCFGVQTGYIDDLTLFNAILSINPQSAGCLGANDMNTLADAYMSTIPALSCSTSIVKIHIKEPLSGLNSYCRSLWHHRLRHGPLRNRRSPKERSSMSFLCHYRNLVISTAQVLNRQK